MLLLHDLLNMGRPPEMRAVVAANEACPTIADGPGRVVLIGFHHLNDDVYALMIASATGGAASEIRRRRK